MSTGMHVLFLLPDSDFDPTEAAVPWRTLRARGHRVSFATPSGSRSAADPVMLSGEGLGPLGRFLRADARGRAAYGELQADATFGSPAKFEDVDPASVDGVVIPGGHAKGMRTLIESEAAQALGAAVLRGGKAVGAICHGVLVLSRAKDPKRVSSALFGRRTTALPRAMELFAFNATRVWAGDYYRTYATPVEDEVRAALAKAADFDAGPGLLSPRSSLRDDPAHLGRGFVVRDGRYVSARWPGDAHAFAAAFAETLEQPS
jgi:putative intracellular protease/amidase